MALSKAAEKALVDVGTNRQGARVDSRVPDAVLQELVNAGLIGSGYGLTRTGSVVRERLFQQRLEELFPI